jgi:4,5:9,10-diseco-3-hydroxy-5,9,17-trioxoandrosta-1(10),2-diene-4-oate hydrolase
MSESLRFAIGVPVPAWLTTRTGTRLAYQRFGSGPPVIALHAVGHGGGDYLPLAARLRGFELIVLDWPGHGRSEHDGCAPSVAHYADVLEDVVNALQLATPVLIGCSIGGGAALAYAARRPVHALVLCNPSSLRPVGESTRRFVSLMVRFFRAGERGRTWFAPLFALYYRTLLRGAPARSQRQRIVAAAYELAPLLRQAWEGFAEPSTDLRSEAARLAVPVLFAWAKHDKIVALRPSLPAVRRVPRHELATFPGGHAAFLECPDAFAERLHTFLERHFTEIAGRIEDDDLGRIAAGAKAPACGID